MYPLPPEPPSPPLHPSRSSRSARLGSLCLMPLLSSLTSLQVPLRLYFCSSCWQAHCSPWDWCYWSLPGRHCQRLPEFEVVSLKMLAGPLPSFPSTQLHNFSLGAETNFTITLLVKNRNILSLLKSKHHRRKRSKYFSFILVKWKEKPLKYCNTVSEVRAVSFFFFSLPSLKIF